MGAYTETQSVLYAPSWREDLLLANKLLNIIQTCRKPVIVRSQDLTMRLQEVVQNHVVYGNYGYTMQVESSGH